MRHLRMFIFLVGVTRALGMFPYHLNRQSSSAIFSWPLLVYSILLTLSLWCFSIYVQITTMTSHYSAANGMRYVLVWFMNTSYLIFAFQIPLYFLVFGRKLANTLASLLEFHDKVLYQFTERKFNKEALFQTCLVLIFGIVIFSFEWGSSWTLIIIYFLELMYSEPSQYITPLFYNAFFKLLSLMLAAAFTPLEKVFERKGSQIRVGRNLLTWGKNNVTILPPHYESSHAGKMRVSENKNKEANTLHVLSRSALLTEPTLSKSLTQEEDALLFARRSIILLEEVEVTVARFFAPLISVQLLLDCILSVTFIIYAIMERYTHQSIIYALAVTFRVYLLLEAPEIYYSKVREAGLPGVVAARPFLYRKLKRLFDYSFSTFFFSKHHLF